jgi:hypothetical protein
MALPLPGGFKDQAVGGLWNAVHGLLMLLGRRGSAAMSVLLARLLAVAVTKGMISLALALSHLRNESYV